MRVSDAVKTIVKELKADEGYRIGWQANIAMAFKDEWQRTVDSGVLPIAQDQIHAIANQAADNFLKTLCR
jgi:hypothetical protein